MEGSASQAGFYYQNNVAALKIIECLFFDTDILQVRLENYDKGNHIDDIIIYRRDKTDYFQVKWSEDGDNSYSLYNLLKAGENADGKTLKKSLFRQLAEGFKSVRQNEANLSITLFTTKKESSQKRPSAGLKHSLPEIRKNIFEPLKHSEGSYDELPCYEDYKDTLEKIREECILDKDGFNEFIKKLEFAFSQEPTINIQHALKFKLETLGIESSLFDTLLNSVVKWSISGESITKDLVLQELGIAGRFEDKLSHYFKVIEEGYYVPNQPFFDDLRVALTELDGGYIFVEGLPGIGKSTALTKFKEEHEDVALAYYCFIPDTKNNFGELRHQSFYFLKSLCITIEKNFPELDLPGKYSDKYDEKLHSYIEALSKAKRKVIFIIDGLDHVHRDVGVGEKSLLHYIKGELPENIFFILSSQYDAVLSPFVKSQINSDARRSIKVLPFTQAEIKEYLENKEIESQDLLDRIERISGGIPVYLHYISELLVKADPKDYEQVMDNFPELVDGRINSYHEYLFQKIENDTFSKWVLAVLAYRKESTTPETIREILKIIGEDRGTIAVTDVINNFSHLLRPIDGRAYSIFHNSFREFILSKTTDLKGTFNTALVTYYELDPFTDEAYRNYYSHLFELGQYGKIISLTTLDWMKTSWHNYRSMEETKENLAIAIQAAIEEISLPEFIRLAFLKSQFDRAAWTLENSEIDFPTLLLQAGKTANSLRNVWDGDFVLTTKEYFCYYLEQYYIKTKSLLPQNILKQGLSKSLQKSDVNGLTKEFKVEALITEDIVALFNEIDGIKWVSSNNTRRNYEKKQHTDKENKKINLSIKSDVVDFLTKLKQHRKLFQLSKSSKKDHKFSSKVKIALINLLLPIPTEKASVVKIIKELDFESVSDKGFVKLICYCADFLSDEEIRELFPARTFGEPTLHEKVVEEQRAKYALHTEILDLYNNLKPIWIYEPGLINTTISKISALTSPARQIYRSILKLSQLWHENRSAQMSESDILAELKQSIQSLYVKRKQEFRTRARGLFDMETDPTFIASSIKHLYEDIFGIAVKLLSRENLEILVDFWISLDKSGDGYKHYTTSLTIANKIYQSRYSDFSNLLYKVITYAEETVREEQDTGTLTSYLGEVAETYGICGFEKDFERNYNQLIDISFGVGHRKDYQSVDIVQPMKLMHEIDPEGTLARLAEVFHIQDMLNAAGNGRMRHICLSYLIKLACSKYPELAFKLMELEEPYIARDEALDIIIEPLIDTCDSNDLRFYLAIIKTLPRWESKSSGDDYFTSLAKKIAGRAMTLKNEQILKETFEVVKFNALVELEDDKLLFPFSELLKEHGLNYADYDLPDPTIVYEKPEKSFLPDSKLDQREKFLISPKKLEFSAVTNLFDENYETFDAYLQACLSAFVRNSRNQLLRKEYITVKSLFEGFYNETSIQNQEVIVSFKHSIIKTFVELKNRIVGFDIQFTFQSKDFKTLVAKSIQKIENLIPEKTFAIYAEKKLDAGRWFKEIEREFKWRSNQYFPLILSDAEIVKLVKQCSIEDIDKILAFVQKWTTDKVREISLVIIANRLIPIDIERAKEIVSLAGSQFHYESAFFQRDNDPDKLEFDILRTVLDADREFGKKLVLNSYYMQNGKYRGEIAGSLDKLLRYSGYFGDEAVKAYYDSNLLNNKELALGLPVKPNRYEFISTHVEKLTFAEVTVKHLVWLFNYPAVKIRELALQSVFDLIHNDPELIKSFIRFSIDDGSFNEIEYSLVVLQAIALEDPKQLIPFKTELKQLLKKEHFNIIASTKELFMLLHQFDISFLTTPEINALRLLNTASPIILTEDSLNRLQKPGKFIYSSFQYDLLYKLNSNEKYGTFFQSVYSDIVAKGFQDYNGEKEGEVHQRYNINTNYDEVEVASQYYDQVKSSINEVFYFKIKRNLFLPEFVSEIRTNFRIYDPSKLIFPIVKRPEYINWIPDTITKDGFMSYSDLAELTKNFVTREGDYITLVESGSQRKSKYMELNGTSYFEIKAYLTKKNFPLANFDPMPFSILENEYAYELPKAGYYSATFPLNQVMPLVQVSYNSFRGQDDSANANLLADIFIDLGIDKKNLLEIIKMSDHYPLKAVKWISSYTSGPSWRRHKPSSEGFTLKIKKDFIVNFLQKNGLMLCYNIMLRRSIDTDRTEDAMHWREIDQNFAAGLKL